MIARLLTFLFVFALISGIAACGGEPESTATDDSATAIETPPTRVKVRQPDQEDAVVLVELPADLKPRRRATLAAEVPGKVEALHFDESSVVGAGRELAQIDTRALEQQVAEAQAMARQSKIAFDTAEKLFEQRTITNTQMLEATTARDVAEARLRSAELQLSKSVLRAPWRGRVGKKYVEVGDFVSPGQPVAELLDTRRLEVHAPAPASSVPTLAAGLSVELRIDGYAGQTFPATITRLGTELDAATRTLDVIADLDNSAGHLRPGMTARMVVPRERIAGALLVPLDAFIEVGDETVVYVVDTSSRVPVASQRKVELGPVIGERVVVTSGLEPTDQVIVEGRFQVAEGQRVDPEIEAPEPLVAGVPES